MATQVPGESGDPLLVTLGQHQLDRIIGQLIDDRDVVDRVGRGENLFVGLGEGVRVVLGVGAPDSAGRDGRDQPVAPGSRGFAQQHLDPDPVGF